MRISDAAEQSGSGVDGRGRRRRRRWSEAQKRRIVTESYQPGISVSVVARRYDVNANLVFSWRRQYPELARMAGGFVPVVVSSTEGAEPTKLLPVPPDIEPSSPRADRDCLGGWLACDGRPGCGCGGAVAGSQSSGAAMIPVPSGARVWLATGVTDMRRGMNTLALQVQQGLGRDPHAGDLFVFRGRKGDLVKILWTDGIGTSLYAKRLERGRFPWPAASGEAVSISAAQLGYLLEGIDWRNPVRTWRPTRAG